MTTDSITHLWPNLSYRDARAAIAFLVDAFGFVEVATYARDDDATVVEHAELRWPPGGGVMLGTAGKDDGPFGRRLPGNDAVYAVCSDPDAWLARASAAGATVVRGIADEDYGSRGFTVRDPEGTLWSFGTYAGGDAVSARQQFDALLRAWSAAIVANDAEAIDRFVRPEWVLVGATGVFPRDAFLEAVATGRLTHDAMTHEITEVRVHGDVAVVLGRGRNHGTLLGDEFTNDEWISEVFVCGADGWRCSVTHLTAAIGS